MSTIFRAADWAGDHVTINGYGGRGTAPTANITVENESVDLTPEMAADLARSLGDWAAEHGAEI